jgi:RecA/RadA recombinase
MTAPAAADRVRARVEKNPLDDRGQLDSAVLATLAPRFRLLSDVDLEQLPPIEFLVEGVLPTAGLGAIYGPPSAGKSFLALDMACSVATGTTWLGRRTVAGSVVYVAAEGSAGLRQRVAAWKTRQGITGISIPVYFVTEPANLLTASDMAALMLAFEGLSAPPVLVIIDTLHRSMPGGDENSAKDVGLVIEHADRLRRLTQAAVLLVHHTAKGSDLERGSSSLRGAVDALLFAKNEDGRRELRCEKAKDWAPFPAIPFDLIPVDASCVVSAAESGDSYGVDAITPPMRQALTILSRDFGGKGATSSAWMKASEMSDATFYRTRGALVREGYVTEPTQSRGGIYRATESGRSTVAINLSRYSHDPITTSASEAIMLSEPRRGDSNDSKARESRPAAFNGAPLTERA